MSGELRLARPALLWGALAVLPAAGVAYLVRDAEGALSVAIGAGLVLANAALAAAISAFAGRMGTAAAAYAALPSFGIRMLMLLLALSALRHQPFIDPESFAIAFGLAVTVVMVAEARTWRRTPWIAMTLKEKP